MGAYMFKIERLAKHHNRAGFDCGNDALNRYLHQYANQHGKKGISKTYVLADNDRILGYYTLLAFAIHQSALQGLPYEVPSVLLGRLAVDLSYQGQGLSHALLTNAIQRTKSVSEEIGIALLAVDLKHQGLIKFYANFGFRQLNGDLKMYLRLTDI